MQHNNKSSVLLPKLRLFLFATITTVFSLNTIAQDTLKIMQYNLLYYGKNVYDCDQTTNNIDHKNTQLQTILAYTQPDIFCVNEMDNSSSDVNYLMNNVLNIGGVDYWEHANVSGSYSINMIYYNSDIFTLNSQESITANPRQTNAYNLTHIASSTDFTVIVAHLKAGSDSDDETDKANATQNVMDYIENNGAGNYIFMGDLNLYSSSSQAFQNLINPSNATLSFYDPADQIGDWSNNSYYSNVHTQSTHTSGTCFVTGGMDDRFDFILMSEDIKDGNNEIKFLDNSYETIGQDGNHYNDAINAGTNNSAPTNVIDALYEMSDHLPVSMEMIFGLSSAPQTVFNKTFNDQDLNSGGWTQFSVTDDLRFWKISNDTYGHNSTYYCKMSGWDNNNSVSVENEDWLISPTFNANELFQETLTFWTAGKYTGNDLQVYYSSNYSDTGNPNLADWTEITGFNLSNTSDYTWESSENIDLSSISGENVRIGFKYTSTENSGSRSWQIDDILLLAKTSNAGIKNNASVIESLSVFPNPSNGLLNISYIQKEASDFEIQIFDLTGSKVFSKEIPFKNMGRNAISISTKDLESGIYLLRTDNRTKKIIIN
jgi:endonuclease/exonuclease/phosphatase family metal-dependent hydrolase